jgi:hypothetical protein
MITQKKLAKAKLLFSNLTDERLGKLFRNVDRINVSTLTDQPEFIFDTSEDGYHARSSIFNAFLKELFVANQDLVLEMKIASEVQAKNMLNTTKQAGKAATEEHRNMFLDDNMNKIFCCRREVIGKAVNHSYFS